MKRQWFLTALVAALSACTGNEASRTGIGEPLVVKVALPPPAKGSILAQFIEGDLPGAPPTDAGLGATDGGVTSGGGVVLNFGAPYVYQGQGNLTISGTAPLDALSVAMRLSDAGTGYWVVPMGSPNPQTNQLDWSAIADFGFNIVPGFHPLKYVAIDGHGVAGRQQVYDKLCVANRVPDNFNSCVATRAPPAAVISLSWDTNVDLDLQVSTPDGSLVDPQNPVTPDKTGTIDRDSNANCVIDGIRYEDLVWGKDAPHGRYGIYVNLVSACKQAIVHFNVAVYTAVDDGTDAGGSKHLQQWYATSGELLDIQANGGSSIGLFVSEFVFN